MKPLLVLATDSREPSGLGEHMLALGTALGDRFEIVIACQNEGNGFVFLKRAARAGLRVKAFDLEKLSSFGAWLAGSGAVLLHVHAGIGWEGHDLVRIGKAAGKAVVRTEHLPYLLTCPVQQAAYGAMLMSADRVITVSRAAFDSFAAKHDPGQFAIVANGIAVRAASVERSAVRAGLGFSTQDKVLLTVARFTAQKGHATLLAAIPEIVRRHPDAKFVWVGDGPELGAMAEAVAARGLGETVTLLGQRDDVADLLGAADVFVLPSHFEGLPLVLLEAMAAGLPIVATAIGGTQEALGESYPFLAPPGDADALAAAVDAILGDPPAAHAAGAAARDRFDGRFTADRMALQTAQTYEAVLPKEVFAASSSPQEVRSA